MRTPRLTRRPRLAIVSVLLIALVAALTQPAVRPAFAADVPPTPHDGAHLVVVRPTGWTDAGGAAAAKTAENAGAAFNKTAVVVARPVAGRFSVRHAGEYTLWVRVGQAAGAGPTPLVAEVVRGEKVVFGGPLNHDAGRAGAGGPAGYRDYREQAPLNSGRDVVGDPELMQRDELPEGKTEEADTGLEDLTEDLEGEIRAGTGADWVNTARVDKVAEDFPFYWWKIGATKLEKGDYTLRVRPQGAAAAGDDAAAAPLLDAAILTTYDKLVYPFVGDVTAPRASYVRFRLDKLPADGLTISADINTHAGPYYRTPAFYMNPGGLSMKKAEPHKAAGFTRWYCLQDVERAPGLDGQEVTLHLMNPAAVAANGARGATQFAVFPHGDAAVRTIGWDEPDGLLISMQPDFEANQHLLRTVRDHAREHYDLALAAADGRPHPLTRGGELSFTNSWGAALGQDYDYMVKSMRLLGFNSVGIRDPLKSRKNYGGFTAQGTSWDASFLPFDEDKARRQYVEHYRNYFKDQDAEMWKGVNTFQIADEPAEAARAEMTAPLWRYEEKGTDSKGGAGGRWVDLSGGSDLHTRKTDFANCVLEGTVTKLADWVGFRVGIDKPEAPANYAYWHVGKVAPFNMPENLAVGKVGLPGAAARPAYILRASAAVGAEPTPFKIIYEGSRAALYLNGQLVHEHKDLPPAGGFGVTGPPKAINALRVRPIGKGEHLTAEFQAAGELVEGGGEEDPILSELDDPDEVAASAPAAKPIKQLVEEEWVPAGGIPEAHAGFRRWAAGRGLKPELFGRKSWDDVRMLTVRELVRNADESRLYYWSRRYSGYLTPRMFALAAEGVRANAPNKEMVNFVGLSGHSLYFPSEMPLDMFEMGNQGYPLMPGISDWMFYGGWGSGWDSHQVVAYSVAPFNAGARRWGADGRSAQPASFPMMHCVAPNVIRSYTMLANQVKFISYFAFGPYYAVPVDYWSEAPSCYEATSLTGNRAGRVDDVLSPARMRPSRVALLYAHSTEYWAPQSSFADRRAAFIGLSHEYFQPELVTEDQIVAGALQHYDALLVMDPNVAAAAQAKIAGWVKGGGLLCASADGLTRDEYNQPLDGLATLANVRRTFAPQPAGGNAEAKAAAEQVTPAPVVAPVKGEIDFRPHTVVTTGMPASVEAKGARVRARYDTGGPAWLESGVGKGKVAYLGHRAGLTYTSKASRPPGYPDVWADTARASLTLPLREAKVGRELVLSEPAVMASPLSTGDGTVVVLYNMRPTPRKGLVLELREPSKPLSVQAFRGFELIAVPFEYAGGRAVITLPEFDGGQMVLVRRKPAPADGRPEETRQRTLAELDSAEWEALSAGAWFAGWHPEWKLADRLVPLLTHERWEVRRSAAESLGRLGHAAAAEALLSAAGREKDSNALGEQLVALARLRHPETFRSATGALNHADPMVRRMATRAVLTFAEPAKTDGQKVQIDAPTREAAMRIARQALADPNLRVRREGIALVLRLDPPQAVALAAAAFGDKGGRATQERPDWAAAVASDEAALAEYVRRGLPGGDELLLSVAAAARPHPALAAAVESRLVELDKAFPGRAVATAAVHQATPSLARSMFERRGQLRPETAAYVTHALERAFDAQLGGVVEDWDAWLRAHTDGGGRATR